MISYDTPKGLVKSIYFNQTVPALPRINLTNAVATWVNYDNNGTLLAYGGSSYNLTTVAGANLFALDITNWCNNFLGCNLTGNIIPGGLSFTLNLSDINYNNYIPVNIVFSIMQDIAYAPGDYSIGFSPLYTY